MKNIKETFAQALSTGKVIVTDILDTKVAGQKRIEVAQELKGEQNLVGLLQGTSNPVVVAWSPVSTSVISSKGIAVGKSLNDLFPENTNGFNIQITEQTQPFTWLDGTTVKVNRSAKMNKSVENGGHYLTCGGKYIFRKTSVVVGPANHIRVQHDAMTSEAPDYDAIEAVYNSATAQAGVQMATR